MRVSLQSGTTPSGKPAVSSSLPYDDDFDGLGAARGVTLWLPFALAYWCLAGALVIAAL